MPASPPRWWSSASWRSRASSAPISAARPSSRRSGSGRRESGGTITRQLRRLGASPDWRARALHHGRGPQPARSARCSSISIAQGLIYRDKRLVNWDPKLHTAISDLEVRAEARSKGHLWHLRYPVEGEPDRFIVVATTRPETMLGDTAVAVHPEDERYKDLVGKHRDPAAGRPRASRSSPTNTPIRRPAAARSRSRRRTTSTISRSAAGTTCR